MHSHLLTNCFVIVASSSGFLAKLENELLSAVNSLGIGPAGVDGDTTALAVKIEMAYTHTAICPIAINFHCWVTGRSGVRIYSDGSTAFKEDM